MSDLIQMARDHGMTLLPDGGHFPTPEQLAAFRAAVLADAAVDLMDGYKVIETALKKAEEYDPNNSPFGMAWEAAQAYQQGLATAYLHALEMIPAATVAALKAERDALREDADRYRWLRHNSSHYVFDSAWIGITAVKEGRCHIFSADEVPALLDAEIDRRRLARTSLDAAIAAGGKT